MHERAHLAPRDYRLDGPERDLAAQRGLVAADWYHPSLPRAQMKQLMTRNDRRAARDTALWLALLAGTGVLAHLAWGTWWAIPAFAVYGTLYGSASDSRWHECGHGTAFKTQWANTVVYNLAAFMVLREPVSWRWSHARHHDDTIIVGRDAEIAVPRGSSLLKLTSELFNLQSGPKELRKLALNCVGAVTSEEREYLPESEYSKACWSARVFVLILAATIGWSAAIGSLEPLMFIGLPTFYGRWLLLVFGLTQHAGLAEDVLDHRLNTRTVLMSPVSRFMYSNMNYHIEHHLFPTVPYHALPALHEAVKADLPPVYHGLRGAYSEILPALRQQAKDPTHFVQRVLPRTHQVAT